MPKIANPPPKSERPKLKRGRKPGCQGQLGQATRERARALAQSEVKPLGVLMESMAYYWNASKAAKNPAAATKHRDKACAVAERVAPYLHPKLQATTVKGDEQNPLAFVVSLPGMEELRKAIRGDDPDD